MKHMHMKKTLMILAGVSSLVLCSPSGYAGDRILAAVGGWSVQKLKAVEAKSACRIYSQFEDNVALSLETEQSRMKAVRILDMAAPFENGAAYSVSIAVVPGYQANVTALAVTPSELVIDVQDGAFMQALQRGMILNVDAQGSRYGFSLGNMADVSRRLMTCRDAQSAPSQSVVSTVAPPEPAAAAAPPAATPASVSPDAPAQVAAQMDAAPQSPPEQVFQMTERKQTGSIKQIIYPTPTVLKTEERGDKDIVISQETQEFVAQEGHVVDTTDAAQGKAVIEPVQTVTRVHTPNVRVMPRENAGHAVDIAIPTTDAAKTLARPPAFEPPAAENQMPDGVAVTARGTEDANAQPKPQPNPNAVLSVADEKTVRLASGTESEQTIHMDNTAVPARNARALLSQGPEREYTRPVVIPKIEGAEMPTRFDLTSRRTEDGVAAPVEQEQYEIRPVSNMDLERNMVAPAQEMAALATDVSGHDVVMPPQDQLQAPQPQIPAAPVAASAAAGAVTAVTAPKQGAETPLPAQQPVVSPQQQAAPPPAPPVPHASAAANVAAPSSVPAEPQWVAEPGADLRATIADWAKRENVELIWETGNPYQVLAPVRVNADFQQALAHLLNQYAQVSGGARPVGQLFVDPESKKRALIIQDDAR